jgi:hypothetical protein
MNVWICTSRQQCTCWCKLASELLHQQLPIKTSIFDRPTLSNAKWNVLNALLGLAGWIYLSWYVSFITLMRTAIHVRMYMYPLYLFLWLLLAASRILLFWEHLCRTARLFNYKRKNYGEANSSCPWCYGCVLLLWYKKPPTRSYAYHRNLNLDFDGAWIR